MKKSPPLDDAEIDLFRQAVAGVRPLKAVKRVMPSKPRPPIQVRPKTEFIEQTLVIEDAEPVQRETILAFRRAGIQNKVFKKLRQGAYHLDAELDLHGMYADQAQLAVNQFLTRCLARQYYCVAIIHGKGGGRGEVYPVLKNKLNNWLRNYNEVLAFHSAPLRHGGAGAVWVLLKNKMLASD